MNNKGSISIEASIVFPIFLFVMLAFVYMTEIYTVKAAVYEASIETAEYMAEYAYLADNIESASVMDYPMACLKFGEYVDSKSLLDKYVVGGRMGVSFLGSSFPDEDGYIDMCVTYYIHINVPIVGNFKQKQTEHIRQKAYLGFNGTNGEEDSSEDDRYVYVAKNGTVYHSTRNCTYIMPDVRSSTKDASIDNGFRPCEYCGSKAGEHVFITTDGECYHSSRSCSRLKRTVSRKKLSEVNLPPCSKCGH